MRKIADCARDLVGTEYVLPEVVLVDTRLRPPGNVLLLDLARILVMLGGWCRLINGDDELRITFVDVNDVGGESGVIEQR